MFNQLRMPTPSRLSRRGAVARQSHFAAANDRLQHMDVLTAHDAADIVLERIREY
jgi:hypothetical protein